VVAQPDWMAAAGTHSRPPIGARFDVVERSLERAVTDHLRGSGEDTAARATRTTIATNSTLVERRGRPLVQLVRTALGKSELTGVRLLDLGCGYGALSLLFATEGASVLGIDAEPERLEVGQRIALAHGLDVRLRAARMESPQLAHAEFDAALINNSFCYVIARDARQRVLEETYRALLPGGVIVLRDPNRLRPRDQFTGRWLIGLLPTRVADVAARGLRRPRSTVRLRSPWIARRELARAGFLQARIESPGGPIRRALAGYTTLSARRPLS
jgi:2-polyprenyl-3-methyl-5-hydroxy-6-metoxy-1,4-benzoquinol methylase